MSDESYFELRGVLKRFDDVVAVDAVDLTVARGEIFALLGPSGCGKSTLLRIIAGLETPSGGEVLLDGVALGPVPVYRRPVNMMFQSYALFPHMSVEQNVAFGLRQDGTGKEDIRRRVDEMLDLVQLSELRRRRPSQLSGGQQQRVALARSLVKRPKLLLLDEPMGALDRKLRGQMQVELAAIIRRVGVTCVMVTHDQDEAMTMSDRIGLMQSGRLAQVGTPSAIYEYPANRFAAEFLGSINWLPARVDGIADGTAELELAGGGRARHGGDPLPEPGARVLLGLRPEKLTIAPQSDTPPEPNRVEGTVESLAYLGTHTSYRVRTAAGAALDALVTNVAHSARRAIGHGERVHVSWAEDSGVLLRQ